MFGRNIFIGFCQNELKFKLQTYRSQVFVMLGLLRDIIKLVVNRPSIIIHSKCISKWVNMKTHTSIFAPIKCFYLGEFACFVTHWVRLKFLKIKAIHPRSETLQHFVINRYIIAVQSFNFVKYHMKWPSIRRKVIAKTFHWNDICEWHNCTILDV